MEKRKYAGFGIRFVAFIIDTIFSVLLFGLGWIVNIYLVGKEGYSVGKRLLGLKVIKDNGKTPIGLTDALVRELIGKIISALIIFIGFFWIAIDSKKQGLHDKIAKTYVVHER